jgi:hypothetical protein
MNERIKQLAEQVYGSSATEQEIEFAQLLIQECGEWFNRRLVVEPDYGIEHRVERNRAVIGLMKEFKEHFG